MSEHLLTGLRPDTPIGAMAALGLLRVCCRIPACGEARLGWREVGAGHRAVLETPSEMGREELLRGLAEDVRDASRRPEFTWADAIEEEKYAEFARGAARTAEPGAAEPAEWAAAFSSDISRRRTSFDTTAGQQKLFVVARAAASGLASGGSRRGGPGATAAFEEALFGPWTYADDQHALGWDPATVRLGAFSHAAPSGLKNAGVRAALWLAFESLPLFPCFQTRSRAATTGFQYPRREFRWPVWEPLLRLEAVRTLLAAPETAQPGVVARYSSRRIEPNGRYGVFLPARLEE